jgi:hypothetical protein
VGLPIAAVVPLGTAINVVAGLLPAPRSVLRAALALALSASVLALPFLVDGPPVFRQVDSTVRALQLMLVIEIVRDPSRFGRGERVVRLALLYDTKAMTRAPPKFPAKDFVVGVAMASVSVASFLLASHIAAPMTPYALAGWPRWLVVGAGGYFFLDGFGRIWLAPLRALGWEHRPVQRSPIRSRTLAEFWGVRWNTTVSGWLRRVCFEPLARRGAPRVGVMASFAASALLHTYMTLAAAGPTPALWMGGFFLLHGVASLVELRLGLRRVRGLAPRVFTWAVFVATIPLFAEAFLRGFGL